VITSVDNEPVKDLDDMLTLLERRAPGDTVTLSVWRNGSTRRQPVTLVAAE
jgi:S1-C subfamily serine protease